MYIPEDALCLAVCHGFFDFYYSGIHVTQVLEVGKNESLVDVEPAGDDVTRILLAEVVELVERLALSAEI